MPPPTIAIFNTSEDTTDMLRLVMEREGFVAVCVFTNAVRDGRIDLEAFIRQHQPSVILYDIAIPYEANWRLFEHIRDSPACEGIAFVVTTTHEKHVRAIAGSDEPMIEIIGKPYDLGLVVSAVREALTRRS